MLLSVVSSSPGSIDQEKPFHCAGSSLLRTKLETAHRLRQLSGRAGGVYELRKVGLQVVSLIVAGTTERTKPVGFL